MSNRFVEQGLSAPVNLTWEVSLACNLRCRHCLSSSGRPAPRELDTAEALDAVDQLHRAGVFQVNFGGGEPFLRPPTSRNRPVSVPNGSSTISMPSVDGRALSATVASAFMGAGP